MILYKQTTYAIVEGLSYKLAEKYTTSCTRCSETRLYTFDEFVSYQKKRKLPNVDITLYNTIPTGIIFSENEDFYSKEDIHKPIEIGIYNTIVQADKYTFDELKTMLTAQEFIKCIIDMIKKEGAL